MKEQVITVRTPAKTNDIFVKRKQRTIVTASIKNRQVVVVEPS